MAVPIPDRVEGAALIARLADGEVHSGAALGRELGGGGGRLHRTIRRLKALGVEIESLRGRGYRLAEPVELLDAARIRETLRGEYAASVRRLDVLLEVDSTNSRLLAASAPPTSLADVCLSEIQSAGRGRRGRLWLSPFGASIAMSLAWTFREGARVKPALSLAVGVAISRALDRAGARGVCLKWPNDVWLADRKIGGVLVELKAEAGGAATVVIGIGLNLRLSPEARRAIEAGGAHVAALQDACTAPLSRNTLAAALLEELLSMLGRFEAEGFEPFRGKWLALDALGGRAARVLEARGGLTGIARGVDVDGALLLESGGRLHRFVSGEVSLRLSEGDA
jgi:BirA family transcriptional regulator, biotin operon repressor / biotin---[acetyl-CoA-carboxylase] ligase